MTSASRYASLIRRLRTARVQGLAAVVAAAVLLGWALNSTASLRYAIIVGAIYGIAILGGNAIAATLGSLNLSLGAFMALGAYVTAYTVQKGLDLVPALLLGMLLAGVVGALIALPLIRLDGIFTALVTFALAFAVPSLIVYAEDLTGGVVGMSLPIEPALFGLTVGGSTTGMAVVCVVVFAVIGVANAWLLTHAPGRIATAVGEEPPAAAVFGIRLGAMKIAIWAYGSAIAGLAGGLLGLAVQYVSPAQFGVMLSIFLFVGGLVGGLRSSWGALVGGVLIGTMPVQLQNIVPEKATSIVFGLVLLATLLAGGRGIADWLERVGARGIAAVRGS